MSCFQIEQCEVEVLHQAWTSPPYQLLDPVSCHQKANPVYYKGKMMGAKILKSKHTDASMNQAENEVIKVANYIHYSCCNLMEKF